MPTSDRRGPVIEFDHVYCSFDSDRVLIADLNLIVESGETLMLLGRSGSGKTTTLKLINRLLKASQGEVRVESRSIETWDVIKLRRHIGYAIQDVGLFPHYTVKQNIGLLPKLENWTRDRIEARVQEVLQIAGLSSQEFAGRYPHQLSGGQRQRVGLARALALDPNILLMDEPFGALDAVTRAEIQNEFRELQRRLQKTIVFVTHDVGEALLLGNRIALMDSGKLYGVYKPHEFVASKDGVVKRYLDAFRLGQKALDS
jgi:osmoprotectant transport system ATP-binding protein